MLVKIRRDSPIGDYVIYPVIEIDYPTFSSLSGYNHLSHWSGAYYFDYINATNDRIYTALSANMPRRYNSAGSIMQSANIIANGTYTDRTFTALTVGDQPADWGSNPHYCGKTTVNDIDRYIPVSVSAAWQASGEYYRDDSDADKRLVSIFYTDAGFSFSCTKMIGDDTSTIPTQRAGNCILPWTASAAYAAYGYPYYWVLNGTKIFVRGNGIFTSDYSRTGSEYINDVFPVVQFIAHTVINDIDYVGVCAARMSNDTDDAYPIAISIAWLDSGVYWGDSVIPSADNAGTWGATSVQSGGNGTFDDTTETVAEIAISALPSVFTGSAGLVQAYQVDAANLQAFASVLYQPSGAGQSFWNAWVNYKFNPISGVISLHTLPALLQPVSTNSVAIHIAGTALLATGNILAEQYYDTATFTLPIPEYFGSRFDYAPHTKITLHLPFVGAPSISPNDCVGGSIGVKYRCDLLTGNVGARVILTNRFGAVKTLIFTGNAAYTLPIVGNDNGMIANKKMLESAGIGAITSAGLGIGGIGRALHNAEYTREKTTVSGDVSSSSAPVSDLALWVEIERPVISTPENFRELCGITSNITSILDAFTGNGFVRVRECHTENITRATEDERAEIDKLLKAGVIF